MKRHLISITCRRRQGQDLPGPLVPVSIPAISPIPPEQVKGKSNDGASPTWGCEHLGEVPYGVPGGGEGGGGRWSSCHAHKTAFSVGFAPAGTKVRGPRNAKQKSTRKGHDIDRVRWIWIELN